MKDENKDSLDGFIRESNQILNELDEIVEKMGGAQESFPQDLMSEYVSKIEKIYANSQCLVELDSRQKGLKVISALSNLCIDLGKKLSHSKDLDYIPIASSFLADVNEVIQDLFLEIGDDDKTNKIAQEFANVLQLRLEWLSQHFSNIEGSKDPAFPDIESETSEFDEDSSVSAESSENLPETQVTDAPQGESMDDKIKFLMEQLGGD